MENMINEMCMFEKYSKQVNDLLVDAYKWKLIAEHEEDAEAKQKYHHISHTLYELYIDEHRYMEAKIK